MSEAPKPKRTALFPDGFQQELLASLIRRYNEWVARTPVFDGALGTGIGRASDRKEGSDGEAGTPK